jgi:general L-amino acid transport system substrate-binding protein
MRLFRVLALVVAAGAFAMPAQAASRLAGIKAKGTLTCGIHAGVAGFAESDGRGGFKGMDVDVCRAVAAAVLGDAAKVAFVPAANVRQLKERDDIDIVSRRITWSLSRGANNGLMFGPVIFHDGQGFLVLKDSGVTSARQLAGKPVCVAADEAHIPTAVNYFKSLGQKILAVAVTTHAEAEHALAAGRCAAYSADVSMLGSARAGMVDGVNKYIILPDMISQEPLAPLVRQGDDQFFEILRWTIFALIAAEEYGVTSANVKEMAAGDTAEIKRLLGVIPGNGAALGLDEAWAARAIAAVGNYGEVFERNVGANSAIKLERGPNKLARDGGLMTAPRLR